MSITDEIEEMISSSMCVSYIYMLLLFFHKLSRGIRIVCALTVLQVHLMILCGSLSICIYICIRISFIGCYFLSLCGKL